MLWSAVDVSHDLHHGLHGAANEKTCAPCWDADLRSHDLDAHGNRTTDLFDIDIASSAMTASPAAHQLPRLREGRPPLEQQPVCLGRPPVDRAGSGAGRPFWPIGHDACLVRSGSPNPLRPGSASVERRAIRESLPEGARRLRQHATPRSLQRRLRGQPASPAGSVPVSDVVEGLGVAERSNSDGPGGAQLVPSQCAWCGPHERNHRPEGEPRKQPACRPAAGGGDLWRGLPCGRPARHGGDGRLLLQVKYEPSHHPLSPSHPDIMETPIGSAEEVLPALAVAIARKRRRNRSLLGQSSSNRPVRGS